VEHKGRSLTNSRRSRAGDRRRSTRTPQSNQRADDHLVETAQQQESLAPLAVLAAFFDRLGRDEPAAIIAGFAFSPLTSASYPELSTAIAHLREVDALANGDD
jgi:hypothetical protein